MAREVELDPVTLGAARREAQRKVRHDVEGAPEIKREVAREVRHDVEGAPEAIREVAREVGHDIADVRR